jgi:hypothetical protein
MPATEPDTIEIVPAKMMRYYKVALRNGTMPKIVAVEDRQPVTRKLTRRSAPANGNLYDRPYDTFDHTYTFEDEMEADAVREYNCGSPPFSDYSRKYLSVERIPVPKQSRRSGGN